MSEVRVTDRYVGHVLSRVEVWILTIKLLHVLLLSF